MAGRKRLAPVLVEGRITTSTSIDLDGAKILAVNGLATGQTVSVAGGMVVLASGSTRHTYQLPVSTAGTMYNIYFSTGPDSANPGASAAGTWVTCDSDCRFGDLRSSAPADKKQHTRKLIGTTGDHCIVIALSSSQWNVVSMSNGMATSSSS